jgi:UDP-N-acetylglucosamine transferase subunit ALG13
MDNHQQDVADKLQAHDYLIVSAVDPPSLAASVRASVSKSFSSLPPPNASKLGYIVDEEIARSQ